MRARLTYNRASKTITVALRKTYGTILYTFFKFVAMCYKCEVDLSLVRLNVVQRFSISLEKFQFVWYFEILSGVWLSPLHLRPAGRPTIHIRHRNREKIIVHYCCYGNDKEASIMRNMLYRLVCSAAMSPSYTSTSRLLNMHKQMLAHFAPSTATLCYGVDNVA